MTHERRRQTCCAILAAIALLALVPIGAAADDGAFEGSVSVIYRHVNVDGSQHKYDEDFDGLDSGGRLDTLFLNWTNLGSSVADYLTVDVRGLGGDPYERTALRFGRQDVYDVRFEQSTQRYIYDLFEAYDDLDAHAWDTRSRRTNLQLKVKATDSLDLLLRFDETDRFGDSTFVKDISREVFLMDAPIDRTRRDYTVGAEARIGAADLIVRQTLRRRDNDFRNTTEGDLGFEPEEPTSLEFYDWRQRETSDASLTTVRFWTPIGERVDLDVSYYGTLFGDEEVESRVRLDGAGTTFTGDTFEIEDGFSRADIEQDLQLIDLDVGVQIIDALAFHVQYRTFEQEARGTLERDLEGEGDVESLETQHDYSVDSITALLQYRPARQLGIAVGYRTTDRELIRDGFEGHRDEDFNSDGDKSLVFELSWKPLRAVTLDLGYEDGDIDEAFARTSALEREQLRARVTFRPKPGMKVGLQYRDFENRKPTSTFASVAEGTSWGLSLWHKPHDRLDYILFYGNRESDTLTDVIYDGAGFGGPAALIDGTSLYASDVDTIYGRVQFRPAEPWRAWVEVLASDAEGENSSFGVDINDPPAVPSILLIGQDYQHAEAGVEYTFSSQIFVSLAVGVFDYDDLNNDLDYEGDTLTLRAGKRF